MPLPEKQFYTSEDYWNLPNGERAELIDGKFYNMAPPNRIHQKLVQQLSLTIGNYITSHGGDCEVYPAPFAVNLDSDDKDWVEPDISVICDKNKLADRGCNGAPDFIIEIVSPSSRKMDYSIKNALYSESGVREYWIVDPAREIIVVYDFPNETPPTIYRFNDSVKVNIYEDFSIDFSQLKL